ncbi:hypothetical protein WDU94_006318, partial [Cyamophila willieti]
LILEHCKTCNSVPRDDKSYLCIQCDYHTCHAFHMKEHIRRHTGEKPFKCSECSYFTNGSALITHLQTHTTERPHECSICDYKTRRIWDLSRHVRAKHQNNKIK